MLFKAQLPKKESIKVEYTQIDYYADLIIERAKELEDNSNILVADGYFVKYEFVNSITASTNFVVAS